MANSSARSVRGAGRASFVADAAQRAFVLDSIADLTAVPELFEPGLQSVYIAANAEPPDVALHAINVDPTEPSIAGEPAAPIRVSIRADAGRVALLLSSPAAVHWDVRATRGASIAGVYLASPEPSEVRCNRSVRGIVPVPDWPIVRRFDIWRDDEKGARALLRKVREGSGRPLASFQAGTSQTFIVPPYRDGVLVQDVLAAHAALVAERTRVTTAPFWLVDDDEIVRIGAREEPIRAPRGLRCVTGPADDGRFYGIDDHDLYAIDRRGDAETIERPAGSSWLGGVAYDSRRQRLVVTTRWHTGTHQTFDIATRTWHPLADVRDTGGGLEAVAYEAETDTLLAMVDHISRPPQLVSYTAELVPVAPVLPSQGLPLPRNGGRHRSVLQLAALPKALAVAMSNAVAGPTYGPRRVQRALLVDLGADRIDLLDLHLDGAEKPAAARIAEAVNSQPYQGFVYVSELRRDTEAIVRHVQQTLEPLVVIGEHHRWAILAGYNRYLGQLAALDETTYPDWSTRLARARDELQREAEVDPPALWRRPTSGAGGLHWTPQAAEDAATLMAQHRRNAGPLKPTLLAGASPMDGPYAGLWVSGVMGVRAIHARRGDQLWMAYIRSGTEQRWGGVAPLPAESQ